MITRTDPVISQTMRPPCFGHRFLATKPSNTFLEAMEIVLEGFVKKGVSRT